MPRKKQPPPEPEVSDKSTKAEILAAYRQLLEDKIQLLEDKIQPQESTLFPEESPVMKPEGKKEIEAVGLDSIVMQLSALRVHVGKYIADIEQKMTEESAKLGALRGAIRDESARLKEVHDIEIAAGKLQDLMDTHAREKQVFEEAASETRAQWDREKKEHELLIKERDALEKKERAREEEDHQYQVKLNRQREKDTFEAEMAAKKKALEEEWAAREASLKSREEDAKAREKELEELRKRVEAFPAQLEKEVKTAEKTAEKATEERLKLEKLLLEKDSEREHELFKLTIGSLQEKVKDQESRIKVLERDLKESMAQAQSVATRAIEGIAGMRPSQEPPRDTPPEGRKAGGS